MALVVKNPPTNAGDKRDGGSILSWEDPPEEGMEIHSGTCLENTMDRAAWQATVHRVTESDMTEVT